MVLNSSTTFWNSVTLTKAWSLSWMIMIKTKKYLREKAQNYLVDQLRRPRHDHVRQLFVLIIGKYSIWISRIKTFNIEGNLHLCQDDPCLTFCCLTFRGTLGQLCKNNDLCIDILTRLFQSGCKARGTTTNRVTRYSESMTKCSFLTRKVIQTKFVVSPYLTRSATFLVTKLPVCFFSML